MQTSDARPVFLPECLKRRAEAGNDAWSLTFLDSKGVPDARWDAGMLHSRTRAIAAELARSVEPGEPVLLVFDPSPTFFAAFLACLWSGRPATPINPPRRNRLTERLDSVASDSGARVALTTDSLAGAVSQWRETSPALAALNWIVVDDLPEDPGCFPTPVAASDLAFIQYTSGSTSAPKGVRITHGNLHYDMEQMAATWALNPSSTLVTWLPAFHDLGLIFGLLLPLHVGCATVQMAPNSFLQRPGLWLEAITHYRGTHSAAPSFAYDLCCRRISAEQRAGLDLSSLIMTMNAAEPINPEVLECFAREFAPFGFARKAFAPAYGLAESTLAVTANPVGEAPVVRHFEAAELERHRVRQSATATPSARAIVGSGRPLEGVPIAIVDPETGRRCPPDRIGEIWVGGPTIADGYWRRPEATAESFGATIAGETHERYLRTGDLGVRVEDELFVTGRIKDLIILSGVNHYPQDIERAAQRAHDALRIDNGAAFAHVDDGGKEQVVLVQELERTRRNDDPTAIFRAILDSVWRELELPLAHISLLSPGGVLRTSSGKIQRNANRAAWLAGDLPMIAQWSRPGAPSSSPSPDSDARDLGEWIHAWLARHLGVARGQIDPRQGFAEMGLDSSGSVELAFDLGAHLEQEFDETLCFDHPSIDAVLAHVFALPKNVAKHDEKREASLPTQRAQAVAGSDLMDLLADIEGGRQ